MGDSTMGFLAIALELFFKTDDTDFRTIEEREVNVLQNLFLVLWDYLRDTHH